MGVIDVPQWLPGAFVRSVLAVGATASREEIEATCRRLLDRWQAPDRHFHNLRHLIDVLARVDELAEETHHPDTVRLAAWYHGAVFSSMPHKAYARSGGEDETSSADLAREELGALGVPDRVTERIGELILNLKRHDASRRDIDCLALSDADLSVLAAEPQKYRAYRKAVRAEYAHLPARHYLEARTAIVTKLLKRREIFVSPMGAQWEDAARENLSAELDRLRAELAELGDADPAASVAAAEAAQGTIVEDAHRADERTSHTFTSARRGAVPTARVMPAPSSATSGTPDDAAPTGARDAGPAAARAANRPSSLEALPDDLATQRRRADETGAPGRDEIARSSRERIEEAVRHGRERVERSRVQRERIATARAERAEALAPSRERRARRADGGASPLTPTSPASAPSPASTGADAAPDGRASTTADVPADGSPETAPADGRADVAADGRAEASADGEVRADGAADVAADSRADGTARNRADVPTAGSPDEASPTHVPPEHRPAVDSVPQMIEPEPLTGELERINEAPLHGIEREPDLLGRPRRKDRRDRKKGRSER